MQIVGNKKITLSPEGVARVLDALAERPYKDVYALIADIVQQLKVQENEQPAVGTSHPERGEGGSS